MPEKRAYICEVATHTSGLGYKNIKEVLEGKFERAIRYAGEYLKEFNHTYMFWSPMVRSGVQTEAVKDVRDGLKERFGVALELVTNQDYLKKLRQVREEATGQTASSPHSVFRLYQIEEHAKKA